MAVFNVEKLCNMVIAALHKEPLVNNLYKLQTYRKILPSKLLASTLS
jgi:hypothetical protein